jgi:Lrp/AsnC family leucine-responsive transcriptional regulator
MQIDRQDRRILRELQLDARLSNAALAARVGLSESACLRRVRLLEQGGVIERYTAMTLARSSRRSRACPK